MTKELIKEKEKTASLEAILENHSIILFNDDVNTFDYPLNNKRYKKGKGKKG